MSHRACSHGALVWHDCRAEVYPGGSTSPAPPRHRSFCRCRRIMGFGDAGLRGAGEPKRQHSLRPCPRLSAVAPTGTGTRCQRLKSPDFFYFFVLLFYYFLFFFLISPTIPRVPRVGGAERWGEWQPQGTRGPLITHLNRCTSAKSHKSFLYFFPLPRRFRVTPRKKYHEPAAKSGRHLRAQAEAGVSGKQTDPPELQPGNCCLTSWEIAGCTSEVSRSRSTAVGQQPAAGVQRASENCRSTDKGA